MTALQLPANGNLLVRAYDSLTNGEAVDPQALVAEHARLFVPAVLAPGKSKVVFERFSLVDPNVRTIIRSSTGGI
jgi:hypothetical protein